VVCGVSGGADSLALLTLAVEAGCEVTALHVDHGLRSESASEAQVVAAACERFGASFRSVTVDVGAGPNLEARARNARLAALGDGALLGHTADDQAETVLLALVRGAGLDGLAGMPPERHPILRLRRAETHGLCRTLGLRPVDDQTNASDAFRRNRMRHEVLPLLDAIADRDVAAVIARQCELLADDAALLDELAAVIDPTDCHALVAAPLPLARRAVRSWLRNPHPPSAAEVERVLAVARGDVVACEIEGGRRISRSAQRLWMSVPR
jgi:tRNA(Ile)-lysidine synthase